VWLPCACLSLPVRCATAPAAEGAVSETPETKIEEEMTSNTEAVASEPLPTNVSEESGNSSHPGEAWCISLGHERKTPVFPFLVRLSDLSSSIVLEEAIQPGVVEADGSGTVSCVS